MIKAVLLDVDNTLLDFNECAKISMRLAAEDFKIELPDNTFEVFVEINDCLWHDIEKGALTTEELYKIRWSKIFLELNMESDGIEFEKVFLKYLAESSETVGGARELLEYLSKKYIVCIASNAPYAQQIQRLKNAKLLSYIQKMFISEKIGYPKPNKEFFEFCVNELQPINTNEIIMIGDSVKADIEGANNFGIKTCLYNHKKEKGVCYAADYTVNLLTEILRIL